MRPIPRISLIAAAFVCQSPSVMAAPAADAEFAAALYNEVRKDQGNVVFSPHSIASALAMVQNGARGETEAEMLRVLRLDPSKAVMNQAFRQQLATANAAGSGMTVSTSLWLREQESYVSDFSSVAEKSYFADLRRVEFSRAPEAARKTINDWVKTEAAGGTEELLRPDSLNPRAKMVVVNLAHFRTGWATPFPEEATSAAPFHLGGGRVREVQMMRQTGTFGYAESEDAQILELPLSEGEQSMLLILPKDPDGLAALERRVAGNPGLLAEWRKSLRPTPVHVSLPKFTTSFGFSVNRALKRLGMVKAFAPGADFSGIDGTGDLVLTEVFHRSVIEVSEGGSGSQSGSAKGGLVYSAKGALVPGAKSADTAFNGDRPFLFSVGDGQTGDTFFTGLVGDPGDSGPDGIWRDGRTFRPTPNTDPVFPSLKSSP